MQAPDKKCKLSFFIKDTYTGDINDPLSLNLYTYCHNEPIMYDDPTGHKYVRKYVAPGYTDLVWEEDSWLKKAGNTISSAWGSTKNWVSYQADVFSGGMEAFSDPVKYQEAMDDIITYGSTADVVLAGIADNMYNTITRPVLVAADIPFNVVRTGLKYGWSANNNLESVTKTFEGMGKGLIGGIFNISPEYAQPEWVKEWTTDTLTDAYSASHPKAAEFFNEHPYIKSVADSSEVFLPFANKLASVSKVKIVNASNKVNNYVTNAMTNANNLVEASTKMGMSSVPNDFGKVGIPTLEKNAVQNGYLKATQNAVVGNGKTVKVYHYTDKKGYNGISSQKPFFFKASSPIKGHPKGVYITTKSPEELAKIPNGYKKLGLTNEKSSYYFELEVDASKLKPIKGDRGEFIKYIEDDLEIPRDLVTGHGETPKGGR